MRKSRLNEGGENIFQRIKRKTAEAENLGKKIIKLSIGQPQGPALFSARWKAADAIMSDEESMHEYQDNGSPGVPNFAKRFVQAHLNQPHRLEGADGIDFLPIPGIKSMLGLIPIACGSEHRAITVATMTEPGYPVPAIQCDYLGIENYALPLNPENKFLFSLNDIRDGTDLVMMNYSNNPSGQVTPKKWLEELCGYCEIYDIRIANDAAYAMLVHSHTKDYSTLTDVAINHSNLSWIELFSASKAIGNGTGWRIGAIVGSDDFVKDIKTIKGNTDSGFAAPLAAGALNAIENDQQGIFKYRDLYERRLNVLIGILSECGMKLAVKPQAGFFVLCKLPAYAFGHGIMNAEHFNDRMIEETGVVGVPMGDYIRYSVAGFPVEEKIQDIAAAFKKTNISYN